MNTVQVSVCILYLMPAIIYRKADEVVAIHEVLRKNRFWVEEKLPVETIITTLQARDVLTAYEYEEVSCQQNYVQKNRVLIDCILRKSPDSFLCLYDVLTNQPGYAYIVNFLLEELHNTNPAVFTEGRVSQ